MNIIYIEDDATNRAVLREMLATAGLPLTEAEDARTGLRLIDTGAYDLVVMDLRMPEISGLTAIRQLRAREDGSRRIPILVVSAELSPGVRDMCRSAGADAFVEKPITMERLFGAIGSTLVNGEGAVLN